MFKVIFLFVLLVFFVGCSENSAPLKEEYYDINQVLDSDTVTVFDGERLILPDFLKCSYVDSRKVVFSSNSKDFKLELQRFSRDSYMDWLNSFYPDSDNVLFSEIKKQIKQNEEVERIDFSLGDVDYGCLINIHSRKGLKNLIRYDGFVVSDSMIYRVNTSFKQCDVKEFRNSALHSIFTFIPL